MLKEIKEGIELASFERTVNQDQIYLFAELSGGDDPLHVDPEFAAKSPFGATLVFGLMPVGYFHTQMYEAFGDAWLKKGKMDIKFTAPILVQQHMVVTAVISAVEPVEGGKQVTVKHTCMVGDKVVTVADSTIVV